MYDDLRGTWLLLTGSTQGIGGAAVQAFAHCGARVGFNGRGAPADLQAWLGRPHEAVPAFLASHAASGDVTGQGLDIDGGQFMP